MITGADVVAYRARRNLSRKALAAATGLTEGKIWRIENKSVIHADERQALELVGVLEMEAVGRVAEPPLQPVQPVPQAIVAANTATDNFLDLVPAAPPTVDFSDLIKVTDTTFTRFVSNSELRTFKRCRRKWWLAWHEGWRLRKESPIGARAIGDRVHRALAQHYSPSGPIDLLAALEGLILIDRSRLTDESEDIRARFEKEADLERIMLEGYLQWVAETGADSELDIVAPEAYVEVGLEEFGDWLAIIGKLDVRVRRRTDGAILFIDHKTVGDLVTPTLTLALDEQMKHYHLLEFIAAGGELHVDGALYSMLRRVKRTATAKPPFYARVEVHHNAHELENYRRRIVGEITDMLEVADQLKSGASHQTVAYPNPTRDCTWDCAFLAVCSMFDDGSRVQAMLDEHFDRGDPLDYYKNEVLGVNE